jgi:hypothetical protein
MRYIITLIFILISNTCFALSIIGSGVSKIAALEDAYLKIGLKKGLVGGTFQLKNDMQLSGGISISNAPLISNIEILSCEQKESIFICEFNFSITNKAMDFTRLVEDIPSIACDEADMSLELYECYKIVEKSKFISSQLTVIKGIIDIKIMRQGRNLEITRHKKRIKIQGIGRTYQDARKSLIKQGEYQVSENKKSQKRNRELYRESLYQVYMKAHSDGDLKEFIKEGMYPTEIISHGRSVVYFVKKLSGKSLLD